MRLKKWPHRSERSSGKAKPRRIGTDEEKATALTALWLHEGSFTRTSNKLGIPRKCLQTWAKDQNIAPRAQAIAHQKSQALSERFEAHAALALEKATGKVDEASYAALMTGAGIAADKAMALRKAAESGRPPSGQPALVCLVVQSHDLAPYLDALHLFVQRAVGGAVPPDGVSHQPRNDEVVATG